MREPSLNADGQQVVVTVDGREVVVSYTTPPENLLGTDRPLGEEQVHTCPHCGAKSLRYHFIDYKPSLAWACLECGYAEHPPIGKLIGDSDAVPEKVEEDWEVCVYPKEWMRYGIKE